MMAIDHRQLAAALHINLDRCHEKADRVARQRQLEADLLAAASTEVAGDRQWYALRTAHCSEIELCKVLTDSAVDAVVPVKEVVQKRNRYFAGPRGKTIHKPVLRNLVFVQLVASPAAYAGLLRVRGVRAIIGREGKPAPISHQDMNSFMHLAQRGAFDERNTPSGLVVGSKVKIKVGAFADFEGVLQGYSRSRGARVLTELFGGEMVIDVTLANLENLE